MKTRIYNLTTNKLLDYNIKFADNYFKRLKGLMFKKNIDYGLIIKTNSKTKFQSSIHSSFMNFDIDVYFVDFENKIFETTTLKPWSKYTPKKKAKYIMEFEKNRIKNEIKIGDEISFVCENR